MPKCSKKRRSSVASTALMRWSGISSSGTESSWSDAALADLVAVAVEEGDAEFAACASAGSLVTSKEGSANASTTRRPPEPSVAASEPTSAASQRKPLTRNWLTKFE